MCCVEGVTTSQAVARARLLHSSLAPGPGLDITLDHWLQACLACPDLVTSLHHIEL